MRLREAHIHNFRGIIDQTICFEPYCLLVGPNNAGKSTVIDALRAFYEKDGFKYKRETDFPCAGSEDQEVWLELTFQLALAEHESLEEPYQTANFQLRLRKYLQGPKDKTGQVFGYDPGGLASKPFSGWKSMQSGSDIIYVPAISKVDDHTKLTGPSALRDLLASILGDIIADSKAYADLRDSFTNFAAALRPESNPDGRSLDRLEEDLNDLLRPWRATVTFDFVPPPAAEIVKTLLQWDLHDEEHGQKQPIENCGSGFQRHFIYSLIGLGARYAAGRRATVAKDNAFCASFNLLLFEEPEAFLHPPQQENLARSLRSLARGQDWQVVCATHSAHFVSRNADDIPALVRLERQDAKVSVYQISRESWSQIADANSLINNIAEKYPKMRRRLGQDDWKPEMEIVKHFLWLNPDRACVFFANHVVLVEGLTEVALINKLLGDGRIATDDAGIYVLDCVGKYNIHRFMNLLSALHIQHAVIHDEDGDGDQHAELNALIDDTAHPELTMCVKRLVPKLETVLGVPSARADHRKPQHMLFHYVSGQIDDAKLNDFCKLVHSCFPGAVPVGPPLAAALPDDETTAGRA